MHGFLEQIRLLRERLRVALLGSAVLPEEDRMSFRSSIWDISFRRTCSVMLALLVLQVWNWVSDMLATSHTPYCPLFRCGIALVALVCIVYLPLFHLASVRKFSPLLRGIILSSCWVFLLIASLPFCYGDFWENGTINNYTLFLLLLATVPIFSGGEIFLYSLIYTGIVFTAGIAWAAPDYLLQQAGILTVLAIFISRMLYQSEMKYFIEKRKLEKANETLRQLSHTDPLVGLLNRRGMEEHFSALLNNLRRKGDSVCFLMLDIDHFKDFNDKYLHTGGDDCLVLIARCLQHQVRRSADVVARYGGEEFCVIVSNMTDESVLELARSIRKGVEETTVPLEFSDYRPHVTVSIGITHAVLEQKQSGGDTMLYNLVNAADKELYHAKESGRNCISFRGTIYH